MPFMNLNRRAFLRTALAAGAGSLLCLPGTAAGSTHVVRRGETLSQIARRHGVSLSELRQANQLRGDVIRIGQTLTIPTLNRAPGVYVVRPGDTLSEIARSHNISIATLREANGLSGDRIVSGQNLVIPRGGSPAAASHVVRPGETLSHISVRYGVSVALLREANHLPNDRIMAGQTLLIPGGGPPVSFSYIGHVVRTSNGINIDTPKWQYIVAHHSGIDRGNARTYDRFHREERRMVNGLAYHFVIGNGRDSGDGEVEVGSRWIQQLQGGHVRNHAVNMSGIGICLVGNFQNSRPSQRQLQACQELIRWLKFDLLGGRPQFTVHREVDRNSTVCPGRHFPVGEMHRMFNA